MPPRAPGPDTSGGAPTAADNRHLHQSDTADQQAAYQAGRGDAANMATRGQSHNGDANTRDAYDYGYDEGTAANGDSDGPGGPPPPGVTPGQSSSTGSSGAAPTPSPSPVGRRGGPRLLGGSGSGGAKSESAAGLLLGMVAYALAINYLRGGMPAVKGWFAAKFLNHPYTGPLDASTYQTPSSPAQPTPNVPVGPPIGVPSVIQSQAGS